ncbi:Cell wall-associated hydrolase, NlpC family [Oribacterium sp. KHPX15]|uniref:NlpC/P60 family protein n=1 Tax=Oribacterium sp. KHPX15 TaxID=1855342 RepID=UPI00089C1277|nr:NlpC/P60 family protein [Oribacterium sp. KHPX15]SDZ90348.1 Cell wall-associated hydrolase, NlpC family [Oribacterium sp. KHPX15]
MSKPKKQLTKKQLTKEQLKKIKLGVLTLCMGLGLLVVVVSQKSVKTVESEAVVETTATPSEIPETTTIEETEPETEEVFVPSPYKLNLAYVFPEGVDESDPLNSYAGEIYKELMKEDNDYIANIYDTSGVTPLSLAKRLGVSSGRVMGKYNPSAGGQDPDNPATWYIPTFKNVNVSFYDADGKRVNEYSNVKEIMSMASVYTYAHDYLDVETFKKYCEELYDKSRRYTISIGKVYYDSGCINRSAKEEGEEAKKIEEELEKLKKQLAEEKTEDSETETSSDSTDAGSHSDQSPESDGTGTEANGNDAGASQGETRQETLDTSGEMSSDLSETETQSNDSDFGAQTDNAGGSEQGVSQQETSYQESSLSDAGNENNGMVLAAAKILNKASWVRRINPLLKITAYGAELSQEESSDMNYESQVIETAPAEIETEASEESTEESSTAYESVSLVPALYDHSAKETLVTKEPESTTSKYWEYKAGQGIDIINDGTTAENKSTEADGDEAVETAEASSEGEGEDKEDKDESSETEEGSTDESKEDRIILGTFTREELRNMDDATLYSLIEESLEAKETTEESNGETDVKSKNYCPGHVDLYVSVTIYGFKEDDGLRSVELEAEKADQEETGEAEETDGSDKEESETVESSESAEDETLEATDNESPGSVWEGWTDEQKAYAERLIAQDWFKVYGLSISTIDPKNPLTEEEISKYIDGLPKDISKDRKRVIKFALESVGKIPYYWGGKASSKNYEGNAFGSVVEADYRGRVLRGLDCSGWIQWVYWSSIGNNLNKAYSTSSLIGEGEKINRADLQPGDVVIRTGADSHVVMFLGWAENGKMIAIHENSGANNVSVNEVTASYPYYRKLIN